MHLTFQLLMDTLTQSSPSLFAALIQGNGQQRMIGSLIVMCGIFAGLLWMLHVHRAKSKMPPGARGDEEGEKAPPKPRPGSPEDLANTLKMYEQVLALARRDGDRAGEAEALNAMGCTQFLAEDLERALANHEQALALCRAARDGHGVTRELRHIGQIHLTRGEAKKARDFFEQALDSARVGGRAKDLSDVFEDLAEAHFALGNDVQGQRCQQEVSNDDPPPSRRRSEAVHLWRCATVLRKLGRRREAVAHGEEALKILERIKDPQVEGVRKVLEVWRSAQRQKPV